MENSFVSVFINHVSMQLTSWLLPFVHPQVVRCTMENSVSVAKTFLLADVIVTEIPEEEPAVPAGAGELFRYLISYYEMMEL